MCEYNLRGLAEPRCPECGYTFEGRDLLDPDRQNTEYSFENLAPPTIRTFWKTAIKGLTPREFWTRLRPNQPAVPYRLSLYWFVGAVALTAATILDRVAENRALLAIPRGLKLVHVLQDEFQFFLLFGNHRVAVADIPCVLNALANHGTGKSQTHSPSTDCHLLL